MSSSKLSNVHQSYKISEANICKDIDTITSSILVKNKMNYYKNKNVSFY